MTTSHNPLRQFFRQPAIYLRLPSNGKHWPAGSLDMPVNGELPVYPMTAIDEITYRTPDALFNGQAVISVIQSCVPAIKNAWHIPNMDMNSVLVAIRIASYSHEMDVTSTCPACSHPADYVVDMRTLLDQMRIPNYAESMSFGDLEVSFKPVTYEQQNQSGMLQFEQQKILNMLPETDLPDEEKMGKLNQALRQITEITISVISKNISAIMAPGIVVTDSDQIEEFLRNCDRSVYHQVRDHVINLNQETQLSPLKIQCVECEHQYEQPMNLDMASFFDSAS